MSFTFNNTFGCSTLNDLAYNAGILNSFEQAIPEISGKELEALRRFKGCVADYRQDIDDLAIEMNSEATASELRATLSSFEDMGKIRIYHQGGKVVYINTTRLHDFSADSIEAKCLNNVLGKRLVKAMS